MYTDLFSSITLTFLYWPCALAFSSEKNAQTKQLKAARKESRRFSALSGEHEAELARQAEEAGIRLAETQAQLSAMGAALARERETASARVSVRIEGCTAQPGFAGGSLPFWGNNLECIVIYTEEIITRDTRIWMTEVYILVDVC